LNEVNILTMRVMLKDVKLSYSIYMFLDKELPEADDRVDSACQDYY
jgi:hypothetical protein